MQNNLTNMETINKNNIEIEVIAEYETMQLEGNAIDSGDADFDRETCDKIREDLDSGNVWAWAQVEVKCTYKGILTASDYLGGCSYASEDDFRSDGYFTDMVGACVTELNNQLKELCNA